MPRKPTIIDIQLNSIVACLTPVLALLNELLDCFGAPFIQAIANTTLDLVSAVQNAKTNKEECVKLTEHIHEILFAIIKLHMQSEAPGGLLPPVTLHHIGKFANTLHKIHIFMEAQQNQSRIKHFLKQGEMRMLLKECQEGLQDALEVFKIQDGATIVTDALKMQETTQKLHEELLDLISNMTEGSSDRSSSIYHNVTGSQNSSISFGLLPAKPKIFHGRESELHEILQKFCNQDAPRVAILGTGGIGKTSLAKVVLHHQDVSANYENRLFVACDSATTSIELAAVVGSNIGLKPGRDLTEPVVQYFSRGPPCLLVLDNLETSWEKIESRGGVEEFLSLLSEVPHLALIITMRGAERPGKVRWTHPLLPPLRPLSNDAARQTFIEITDNDCDSHEITQLLELTDNLPLAVDLLAHLVDYEGCSSVLHRWQTEKTGLLSEGHGKSSNLDSSIAVSLSSPRLTSGAKNLLTLLSILPDGLSNVELLQSNLPIPDILTCKAVLLQTSLAYIDNMRLKVLVPIREHMQHVHPPSPNLVQPLRKHFHSLLDLYRTHFGVQIEGMTDQINSNLHNIQHILLPSLHPDNPELSGNIYCILAFNSFRRRAGHGRSALMDQIPYLLPQLGDPTLEINVTIEMLNTASHYPIPNPEVLIDRAVHHLTNLNDDSLACECLILIPP
ncbi:P-loop containing nucleoside triphosphate hydrolase protein [Mycena latifolia]|nr:P-loop containing nucleoside triphosphate hydrolase protein [Mycena latifolia]